ncbi:Rossman fold protein, TIGR00730 family [Vagococcus elongatus]|uniref:Cytokinin riboside 5'-monophosphate phosphoribohydrolase n=1 Tax=Vagococcus elongatus TaxID=180344 RepID=A0A430AMY8_9ENTE|nr:Rossman fold protein, TIGR00730 family [Vagococcus elongatus]
MKRIAVYCGSTVGENPIYGEKALELAEWMTRHQYDLVYGGSKIGLMGILSTRLLTNKREVFGVMPNFLKDKELAQDNLTQLYMVDDMRQRKQKMMDLSDAFLAMPGGLGTLEEIAEAISSSRIGLHRKPSVFFNVDGYYHALESFFDTMTAEGFLDEENRRTVLFSDSLEEIYDFIITYQPPKTGVYDK